MQSIYWDLSLAIDTPKWSGIQKKNLMGTIAPIFGAPLTSHDS